MNVEKKTKKNIMLKKTVSLFEGTPFKPFEHTKTFFRKILLIFFFNIHENAFDNNSIFFFKQKMHLIKKY